MKLKYTQLQQAFTEGCIGNCTPILGVLSKLTFRGMASIIVGYDYDTFMRIIRQNWFLYQGAMIIGDQTSLVRDNQIIWWSGPNDRSLIRRIEVEMEVEV